MGGRADDGQQRLHRITTSGAVAKVRPQRHCNRGGVADRVQRLHLIGDEPPNVLRLNFTKDHWSTCELVKQQALDDAQVAPACSIGQASGVTHAGVVVAKLVGDRACWRRQFSDDAALAQDRQQGCQRGMKRFRRAQRLARAVAARQVVAQKLVNAAIVQQLCRQETLSHPVREVRHAVQTVPSRAGRIATAPESRDIRRNVRRKWPFEQPGSNYRLQCSNLRHDGLQK